jgi:hypothetical protein
VARKSALLEEVVEAAMVPIVAARAVVANEDGGGGDDGSECEEEEEPRPRNGNAAAVEGAWHDEWKMIGTSDCSESAWRRDGDSCAPNEHCWHGGDVGRQHAAAAAVVVAVGNRHFANN